jgi:Na+/H+-dicarboxylate symporter
MCRTALNVTGDLAIATMVSRGEEHVPTPVLPGEDHARAVEPPPPSRL